MSPPPRSWRLMSSPTTALASSSTAGTSSARSRKPISGSGTSTRTSRLADASYPTASVTRPSALRRVRVTDALVGYLFVSPLCVLVLGLVAYPLGNAVWISLTALTWHWMFNALWGLINVTLQGVGLQREPIAWLGQPATAMAAVITANVWRGFPFFGVSLLAGMQTIPRDLYEAAAVDGASPAQRFWHITLPGLRLVLLVTTLISLIFTLNDFNIVYVLTRGGPGTATHVLATYTYEIGFQALRWGQAVAVSMFLMPVIAVMIVIVTRYLTREE